MRRLIFATGKWSVLLGASFVASRGVTQECENILVHISHICTQSYLDDFNAFAANLGIFSRVECLNYCVYQHATVDNLNDGNLEEKSNVEAEMLIWSVLGNESFDEIIVPHLFSKKSGLLLSMYPDADAFCIEEGLNSYFRYYGTSSLNMDQQFFVNRLSGYVSFNFLGLKPLFAFEKHGVPVVTPDLKFLREAVESLPGRISIDADEPETNKVLFIGQFPRSDMSENELLEHYLSSISSLLHYGLSVHFVRHPRDSSRLTAWLAEAFAGRAFAILDAKVPVERIVAEGNWTAVFSYASTALITIPALFGTPAFTIDEIDLERRAPGAGDFSNAGNICAAMLPSLRMLMISLNKGDDSPADAAKKIFSSYKAKPDLLNKIYHGSNAPDAASLELKEAMKLPLRGLERRIARRPFNSLFRLAASQKEMKYGKSVRYAWQGVLLNPTRISSFLILVKAVFAVSKLWTLGNIPTEEAQIKRIAESDPLSLRALLGSAGINERKSQMSKALDFYVKALYSHPLNPSSYMALGALGWRLFSKKVRSNIGSPVFLTIFRLSVLLVRAKAKWIKLTTKEFKQDIAALTYRFDKGATGGPGGVLALQRAIVGPCNDKLAIDYHFRENQSYLDWYAHLVGGAQFALDICKTGKYGYYFAHDLGTAYGLALAGKPYVLDWHFQGSFVTQELGFGRDFTPSFIKSLKKMEAAALKNAKYVVFPSDGARDMYFSDEYRGCNLDEVRVGSAVYNTILPGIARPDLNNLKIPSFAGLTFTSVGTLTLAKGQDQVLDFFEKMLPVTETAVRWICIGNGTLHDSILERARALSKEFNKFEFLYLPRIPHSEVMGALYMTDVYIMLHRISIFDFATLEAMKNNCAIILSKVGGNIDFNKRDNVMFAEDVDFSNKEIFSKENVEKLKRLNTEVLNTYFSVQNFKDLNISILGDLTAD